MLTHTKVNLLTHSKLTVIYKVHYFKDYMHSDLDFKVLVCSDSKFL